LLVVRVTCFLDCVVLVLVLTLFAGFSWYILFHVNKMMMIMMMI